MAAFTAQSSASTRSLRNRREDCIGQSTATTSIIILIFVLSHMPRLVTGLEPGFISPLENITVAAGRSTQFTCVVKHLGGHKVAWLRSDSKAILAIHTHMVTNNPRMSVNHNGHNSWTLEIDVVQRNDSGLYMCQINTEPMTSQVGVLNVVEAPDILYNETSNDTIVAEGASVSLRCEARGYPEPTVTWRREDGAPIVLRHHQPNSNTRLQTVEGNELKLQGLTRSDMGAYLCIATNGIPSPVSKRIMVHVHFHPLVKVHDQIITTRLGSTVTLQCSVEAYPKSVHFWTKSRNGEETTINSSDDDHKLTDHDTQTMYSFEISLTIVGVKPSDLGNYTCEARNSYGTVRGTIQLEKMRETQRTTTSVKPDTLPDDSQYKYNRYNSPDRQKNKKKGGGRNRNYDQGKPATIYQIGATTELSTNDEHRYNFRTPPSYQHENNNQIGGEKNNRKTSSTSQTESFFSSDAGCGNHHYYLKSFCLNIIVTLFVILLTC